MVSVQRLRDFATLSHKWAASIKPRSSCLRDIYERRREKTVTLSDTGRHQGSNAFQTHQDLCTYEFLVPACLDLHKCKLGSQHWEGKVEIISHPYSRSHSQLTKEKYILFNKVSLSNIRHLRAGSMASSRQSSRYFLEIFLSHNMMHFGNMFYLICLLLIYYGH